MAGSGDSGPVRRALTGLLDAWLELDRQGAALLERAREQAAVVARAAEGARPDGAALATEVVSRVSTGTVAAEAELGGLARVFAGETQALAELLTGAPGVVTAPALGSGPEAIVTAFPEGAQRDYVAVLVADAAVEERQPSEAAEQAPAINAIPLSVGAALREEFDKVLGDEILTMVLHEKGHTVQLHGPDVPDEALIARLSWKKDPMGRADIKNAWRREPDGTVHTQHGIGHVVGKFTSIAALVKPLKAVLAPSGGTIQGMYDYLAEEASMGRTWIFVPADVAGLEPGDTTGFRGSGTRTPEMAFHWKAARRDTMEAGGGPMPVVRTDLIAEGRDPGAAMIFDRTDSGAWMLVTCYPAGVPDEKFTRLRSSTS